MIMAVIVIDEALGPCLLSGSTLARVESIGRGIQWAIRIFRIFWEEK